MVKGSIIVKILTKNDIAEKLKTRKLYVEAFFEKKDYLDYYYETIIKRNEIVVAIDSIVDEIVAMIHLNPYLYNICGKKCVIYYMVAVATKKEYRRQGIIKQLFDESCKYLKDKGVPFCFLMPNDEEKEKMYQKLGFVKIADFVYDKFSNETFDIYPIRDDEFDCLMKKEKEFCDKETEEYRMWLKKQVIMAKILNSDIMEDLMKEDKTDNEDGLSWLKSKKCYFCQEV